MEEYAHDLRYKKKYKMSAEETLVLIAEKFSQTDGISETLSAEQLQTALHNIIMASRNAVTAEKKESMGTGGGPPPESVSVDPDVASMAPHLTVLAPCPISSDMNKSEMDSAETEVIATVDRPVINVDEMVHDSKVLSVPSSVRIEDERSTAMGTTEQGGGWSDAEVCRDLLFLPPPAVCTCTEPFRMRNKSERSDVQECMEAVMHLDVERAERLRVQDEALFELHRQSELQHQKHQAALFELKKQELHTLFELKQQEQETLFKLKKKVLEAELKAAKAKLDQLDL